MKRILKSLISIALVFSLGISLNPVNALAASKRYGTIVKSTSGYVSTTLYPGAKPKKAKFKIQTELVNDTLIDTNDDFIEYSEYKVSVTIDRKNLTKKEIVNIVKDIKNKKTSFNDYIAIFIDKDGDPASNIIVSGGMDDDLSSPGERVEAKYNKRIYYINSYRKVSVLTYKVLIPHGGEAVYFGVAGQKNGQITNDNRSKYRQRRINFYQAGYGNSKRGFAYVKKLN